MIHDLKIWPKYYERVLEGSKTFEVRKNDRAFQCGDEVFLREWDPELKLPGYTSRVVHFKIGFVLPVDAERVAFSLLPLSEKS